MPDFITEIRTFTPESGGSVFDGWAGFQRGRQYSLTYERRSDGTVAIVLDHHVHVSKGAGPLVVREAEFERWFRK